MNDTYPGNNGVSGSWGFSGQFTDNSGAAGGPDNSYADFLLGLPGSVAVGEPISFHLVNSLGAGFVQDDFLVEHGLTLNLGLRYEVVTPRGDRTDEQQRELRQGDGHAGDRRRTTTPTGEWAT